LGKISKEVAFAQIKTELTNAEEFTDGKRQIIGWILLPH